MGEAGRPDTASPPKDGSAGLAARVHAERVRLFYKQQRTTIAASTTIACFLVTILWSESGLSATLIGWLVTMIAIQIGRFVLQLVFMRVSPGVDGAVRWGRIAVLTTGLAGICWGASVLLFFEPTSPMNLVAMTMTATGVASGGLAVLSALPAAYLAYLVSHISPVVVLLAVTGEFVYLVFAACFVFFLVVLVASVRAMGALLEESLHLRFGRMEMIEHLDQARINAEVAGRAKAEFLGMMTHELKTPLNAIIGYAALIGSLPGASQQGKLEGYTSEIHGGARRLLALINDILDLSKADSGKLDLQEGMFSTGAAIERCWQLIQPHAEEARVELTMDLPESLPALRGDERLIRQAVLNLVSNAIKFTPAGGSVRIGAQHTEEGLVIEVVDTGIGIAPEDLPRAMEPFEQISRGYARERSGSGIGLPLAKRIAELHRGRLEITSRTGVGTTARLILPPERVIP
ncbi:MAG: HAMP domain-containing histidine kinase [Alphaproteobacteria bacterium]|nr:HAMP domain-containing histidine kinase [Alphaproteobacteria bacterium]